MKFFIRVFLGALILSVVLAGCGSSNEKKIVGSWKVVEGEKVLSYMEINEDRIIVRKEENDGPMTVDYLLTDTENNRFILEMVNPESRINEFIFEGYFDNKNRIIVTNTPNGSADNQGLIRVKNIAEDMAKEEKRTQAQKEKVEKEETEKRKLQAQKDKEIEKEREKERQKAREIEEKSLQAQQEETERQFAKEERERQQSSAAGLKDQYLQRAENLDNRIITEAKKFYAHDMPVGFYGQYYNEWDGLLNEVWGVLKDTMPSGAFQELQSSQIEWVKLKEQHFDEIPDEPASSRAGGMDYLANETADRTYYLIHNYMND